MLDYADAVLQKRRATPPKALNEGWKIKGHGMPYSGGWMEQPAGMMNRAMTALNVYENYTSWYVADRTRWEARNPEGALVVGAALKLRRNG